MAKTVNLLLLPGDGIGPEITAEVQKLLAWFNAHTAYDFVLEEALMGGCAIDTHQDPYPQPTRDAVDRADAVFLGAVGGPKWDGDDTPPAIRPEKGLLALRQHMNTFANLRPAKVFGPLAEASSLKPEIADGLDILFVRELVSGIYFGEHTLKEDEGHDVMTYRKDEVERIARVALTLAQEGGKRLCSVDKANVLSASQLWRKTVIELHQKEFADVELSHMYVDNAAMQIASKPDQFDIIVTGNMFGDILSDLGGALTGSLGMLPSASLSTPGQPGLYEPIHGSAPDIAGQGIANPLASLLSIALLFRCQLNDEESAQMIEQAVEAVLAAGHRTADIARGRPSVSTEQMGDYVISILEERAS